MWRPGDRRSSFQLEIPFPDFVNRRIDHQFQQERSKDSADHRRGDALHHIGARARRPHDRAPGPMNIVATVMNFGRMRFTAPCKIACRKFGADCSSRPCAFACVVGQVEIEQHEHAGFGVHAHQRDQTRPRPPMLML